MEEQITMVDRITPTLITIATLGIIQHITQSITHTLTTIATPGIIQRITRIRATIIATHGVITHTTTGTAVNRKGRIWPELPLSTFLDFSSSRRNHLTLRSFEASRSAIKRPHELDEEGR
jgi:hypothetical protein